MTSLMRHATLVATNGDLQTHARECTCTNEKTRMELQIYTKGRTDEILNLNNKISQLKKLLESLMRHATLATNRFPTSEAGRRDAASGVGLGGGAGGRPPRGLGGPHRGPRCPGAGGGAV